MRRLPRALGAVRVLAGAGGRLGATVPGVPAPIFLLHTMLDAAAAPAKHSAVAGIVKAAAAAAGEAERAA